MNRLIIITFLLITSFSFSQIKKVDNTEAILIGKVNGINCYKVDNLYTFKYNDANYIHIDAFKSFYFEDINNSFNKLYKIIMDGFNNAPQKDIKIEIPKGDLILQYKKVIGTVNLTIFINQNDVSGKTIFLTKRRVNKLFGK